MRAQSNLPQQWKVVWGGGESVNQGLLFSGLLALDCTSLTFDLRLLFCTLLRVQGVPYLWP